MGCDAKILTVPARDPRYGDLQDMSDAPGYLCREITQFFDIYKELEPGKSTDVRGWQDRAAAEQVIAEALARARDPAPAGPAIRPFRDGQDRADSGHARC
jgi:inorganic pyrophosphatase